MPHSIEPLKRPKMQRIRRSPTQWADLVAEWERSDMSQKAFCELKGLCYRNFSQWKSRLKKNRDNSEQSSLQPHGFMPVQLNTSRQLPADFPSELEVCLPSAIKLTLRSDLPSITALIKNLVNLSC